MAPRPLLKLGVLGRCGMLFMVTFNLALLLLSLGLLAIGILSKLDSTVIDDDEIVAIFNDVTYNGVLPLGKVAGDLPLVVICVAGVDFLVTVVGLCAACQKNKVALVTYAYLTLLTLVVQAITTGMLYVMNSKVQNNLRSSLDASFRTYEGVDSTNETTIGWDHIFLNFECCGREEIGSLTENEYEFNETVWWGVRVSSLDMVPASCCSEATRDTYKTLTDTDCERTLLTHNKKGCYQALHDYFTKYERYAIDVSIALLVFQVPCLVIPFLLCHSIGRAKTIT